MHKNQWMILHSFENNAGSCQLRFGLSAFVCFCFMNKKYYLSKLMLLTFHWQKISLLCKQGNKQSNSISVIVFIYLFIYLLYLTLVYKIVESNSTNKYQQNQIKI